MSRIAAALAVLAALISGCAGVSLDPVDDAVAEALAAARAPALEQKAALGRAQARFLAEDSATNRVRLAVLLVSLPAPLRDDARAIVLLDPVADGRTAAGRFAALLSAQAAERQRLARELERQAREREKLERERSAADKERDKREEALRQQLEALRSIERGILEREERLRRRPR